MQLPQPLSPAFNFHSFCERTTMGVPVPFCRMPSPAKVSHNIVSQKWKAAESNQRNYTAPGASIGRISRVVNKCSQGTSRECVPPACDGAEKQNRRKHVHRGASRAFATVRRVSSKGDK